MLPRGEVTLIFASIGLAQGVIGGDLYAALLAVVLGTTLLSPPLLRSRIERLRRQQRQRPMESAPPGGWLRVGEEVELIGTPPDEEAIVVALDAALLVANARPSVGLLDWLGSIDPAAAHWDDRATSRLLAILRDGSVRSWRFLEAAGVLERALPELAAAVRHRRADPFLLDPSHVLRFDLVEAVRDVVHHDPRAAEAFERLQYPEQPLLAALVIAAAGEGGSPNDLARRIADRLRLGETAGSELTRLVADRGLLRAAATRVDGLDEEPVLQLATHLTTSERSSSLYVLSLAFGELEPWERDRLDELIRRVLSVQARPELTGRDAEAMVDKRRREAIRLVGDVPRVAEWVRTAPRTYLIATPEADVARHATLMEPLPGRGKARVSVEPLDEGETRIEIAARDRSGLIAAVSGALSLHGLDVLSATMATWSNGAALQSFRVRLLPGSPALDDDALAKAVGAALDEPLASPAEPDLVVTFDDDGSPWYTLCEVRGRDRRGLLHSITVGFAAAEVSVHSARVDTRSDVAIDRFEVSDVDGRKLDDAHKRATIAAISGGVEPTRTGRAHRRRRRRLRASDPV
jgi:[protein-PII] uridylyltransferase